MQKDPCTFDHPEMQIYNNIDVHDKDQFMLFHQFVDILVRFFYLRNNRQQENLDQYIENLIQIKLL